MSCRRKFVPLLFSLFLFLLISACNDLDSAGNINQPERPPEGAFGVSETFGGPYLGVDNPVTDPADAPILEVEPGGTFYARAVYESLVGITDITVSLVNATPEGLAGPLDPTQSFFTLGAPTSISEPGGGCELTGEDAEVICIYEIQVAEDAVNVSELEGAEGEFAYIFTSEATNAAGVTSDEDLRAYVRIVGDGAEEPEPKPEPVVCTDPVEIPDEALRRAIREELEPVENDTITCEDLASLTIVTGFGDLIGGISSLEGLQFATNLEVVSLQIDEEDQEATSISDLSPLAGLTKLRVIKIETENRNIEDIGPLSGLINLESLQLVDNKIADISALTNLTKLSVLELNANDISDLSPLSNLTSLEELVLQSNEISDLNPLANLTNLQYLGLTDNEVRDLSPLENLTKIRGLVLGDNSADNNLVSDLSPLQNLTNLEDLYLGGNEVSDLTPLQNLVNLENLNLSYNRVTDISALVANEGLGSEREGERTSDFVNVSNNPLNTCPGTQGREDIDTLIERGVEVSFDELEDCDTDGGNGETCTSPVEVPDEFVERDVREALDKPQGELTCEDLESLTELVTGPEGDDDRPFSLEGLQYATNLEKLTVAGNRLSDLEPLRNLPNLSELVLDSMGGGTTIDIAALAEVETLEILKFSFGSGILSLEPLEGLTGLRVLELEEVDVEEGDAGVLQSLTGLQRLVINGVGGDGILGIRTLEPLVNNEGLSEGDTLDLRNNLDLGLDTYFIDTCPGTDDREAIETLLARGVEVAFDEPVNCRPEGTQIEACSGPVNVPDEALARSIRATLEQGALQGGLTGANLAELESLSDDSGVQSLEGLQCAINLQVLSIESSQVEDVSPLQNLTRLDSLRVDGGRIDDLTALQNLVGLRALFFYENEVDDLSPLAGLVQLDTVGFAGNEVSDLSPLVELVDEGSLMGENSFVDVRENPVDTCPGSDAREDIDTLIGRGVRVLFDEPECDAN